jgi:hypothetical protein
LQEFLQGGFLVAVSDVVAAFDQRVFQQRAAQHFAGRGKPGVQINCGHHRFKSIRKQRRLLAASGLFLAATESEMLTEVQTSSSNLQRLRIDHAGAAL